MSRDPLPRNQEAGVEVRRVYGDVKEAAGVAVGLQAAGKEGVELGGEGDGMSCCGTDSTGELAVGIEAVAQLFHGAELCAYGSFRYLELDFGERAKEEEIDACV